MKGLSSTERRTLRARAHPLKPVVTLGNAGLTPGVMAEVERSLKAHELIKIRVGGMEHSGRESVCAAICAQTGAAPVQHIGKILVVYRKREEAKAAPRTPSPKAAKPGERAARQSFGRPSLRNNGVASRIDAGRRPRSARR